MPALQAAPRGVETMRPISQHFSMHREVSLLKCARLRRDPGFHEQVDACLGCDDARLARCSEFEASSVRPE